MVFILMLLRLIRSFEIHRTIWKIRQSHSETRNFHSVMIVLKCEIKQDGVCNSILSSLLWIAIPVTRLNQFQLRDAHWTIFGANKAKHSDISLKILAKISCFYGGNATKFLWPVDGLIFKKVIEWSVPTCCGVRSLLNSHLAGYFWLEWPRTSCFPLSSLLGGALWQKTGNELIVLEVIFKDKPPN